jgi:hypothetical protein
MSQRAGTNMSDVMVARYKDEFTNNKPRVFKLNDDVSVELRVPSVKEYINSGYAWVTSLVSMADRVFSIENSADQRNEYINNHSRATIMRQYGHWVQSIHVGTSVIEDTDSISSALEVLSTDDEVRRRYTEAVTAFMNDATVSVIAVPTVSAAEENVYPRWPRLVPIDAVNVFFTLVGQKTDQIANR